MSGKDALDAKVEQATTLEIRACPGDVRTAQKELIREHRFRFFEKTRAFFVREKSGPNKERFWHRAIGVFRLCPTWSASSVPEV